MVNTHLDRSIRNALRSAHPEASECWVAACTVEFGPHAVMLGGEIGLTSEGAALMRLLAPALAAYVKAPRGC